MANAIYDYNNVTAQVDQIPLKGFAIGNGCTNWTYDTMPATLNMTYGHALFNTELWDKMTDNFCDYSGIEFD